MFFKFQWNDIIVLAVIGADRRVYWKLVDIAKVLQFKSPYLTAHLKYTHKLKDIVGFFRMTSGVLRTLLIEHSALLEFLASSYTKNCRRAEVLRNLLMNHDTNVFFIKGDARLPSMERKKAPHVRVCCSFGSNIINFTQFVIDYSKKVMEHIYHQDRLYTDQVFKDYFNSSSTTVPPAAAAPDMSPDAAASNSTIEYSYMATVPPAAAASDSTNEYSYMTTVSPDAPDMSPAAEKKCRLAIKYPCSPATPEADHNYAYTPMPPSYTPMLPSYTSMPDHNYIAMPSSSTPVTDHNYTSMSPSYTPETVNEPRTVNDPMSPPPPPETTVATILKRKITLELDEEEEKDGFGIWICGSRKVILFDSKTKIMLQ